MRHNVKHTKKHFLKKFVLFDFGKCLGILWPV